MLELLFINKERLVADVVVRSCLGLSDHEMTELSVLGEVNRGVNKITTMDFQRADLSLFRTLIEKVSWQSPEGQRGPVQEDRHFSRRKS